MLVGLFEHPDPLVRGEAALRLGQVIDRDAATGLAQLSLADPDPDVRRAAALAIAYALDPAPGQPGLPGLERLVAADSESATHQAARAALITVRDRQPASNRSIPSPLRLAVQRAVWRERWKRHWGEILGRTLQGFQGGFWGLGLSLGLLLFPLFDLHSGRLLQGNRRRPAVSHVADARYGAAGGSGRRSGRRHGRLWLDGAGSCGGPAETVARLGV